MSTRSNKHSCAPANRSDAKRPRFSHDKDKTGFVQDMPTGDCAVHILQFLGEENLANAAQVSSRFREECCHPVLSQKRTVTIRCVRSRRIDYNLPKVQVKYAASLSSLLHKVTQMEESGKFALFTKLKLEQHNHLDRLSSREVRLFLQGNSVRATVTALDLSFPNRMFQKDRVLKVCVPTSLSALMKNLREVNLSNAKVSQSVLRDFAHNCPLLEKVVWNNYCKASLNRWDFISGAELSYCQNLKDISMDDWYFNCYTPKSAPFQAPGGQVCIFFHCNSKLERVSLKNARCYSHQKRERMPQAVLIQFVRHTPSLRWFRSDLSPENVAILQAERPEITFA
jgi:hypothetical protein